MSLAAHLIHRATIARAPSSTDGYGHDVDDGVPVVVASAVPCRLVARQQQVTVSDSVERAVVTRYTVLFGPEVDLRHGDDLTIGGAAYLVTAILCRTSTRQHHRSCEVERR